MVYKYFLNSNSKCKRVYEFRLLRQRINARTLSLHTVPMQQNVSNWYFEGKDGRTSKKKYEASIHTSASDYKGRKTYISKGPSEAMSLLLSTCKSPNQLHSKKCRDKIRSAIAKTSVKDVLAFYSFIKQLELGVSDDPEDDEEEIRIDMEAIRSVVYEIENERENNVELLNGLFTRL
jgi:hypothetical protein